MIERFTELLQQLSVEFGVTLHPDKEESCVLAIDDWLRIQLECHVKPEMLLIASFISEIPPGKFREKTLKDALKANYPLPRAGTLAYSERNQQLVLFHFLALAQLTGAKLAQFLSSFIEKATAWRAAIASGNTEGLVPKTKKSSSSMFGLK